MARPRTTGISAVLAERFGVDEDQVHNELEARLSSLWSTLTGDAPADSAEVATAHCDLWALNGFVTDARHALAGKEVSA
jgi:hypothetical protein